MCARVFFFMFDKLQFKLTAVCCRQDLFESLVGTCFGHHWCDGRRQCVRKTATNALSETRRLKMHIQRSQYPQHVPKKRERQILKVTVATVDCLAGPSRTLQVVGAGSEYNCTVSRVAGIYCKGWLHFTPAVTQRVKLTEKVDETSGVATSNEMDGKS